MEEAHREKELGSKAWAEANYEDAIAHFTNAINSATATNSSASSTDKEFLKTVYSNRSASYMKLGRAHAALLDADKCVELDQAWSKGFVRKGDALLKLNRNVEAYNAYNAASRITPNDASITQKLEMAMRYMRSESADSSSSRSAAGSTSSLHSAPRLVILMKIAICISAVLHLLPIGPLKLLSYRVFTFGSIANYIASLYFTHGFPKLNMEYAQRLLVDPTAMYLFMAFVLLMSRPYLLAMAPIFLTESIHVVHYLANTQIPQAQPLFDKIVPLIDRYAPNVFARSEDEWRLLTKQSKINVVSNKFLEFAANCEVMQGVYLIVELLLPTRNFVGVAMWWQMLQMKYLLDRHGHLKNAFATLDYKITTLVSHQYCPAMIAQGYHMLKAFLAKQVQLPQPGEAPRSPSCSVM